MRVASRTHDRFQASREIGTGNVGVKPEKRRSSFLLDVHPAVAKIFGKLLEELGQRSNNFLETDANKLMQAGSKKFIDETLPKVNGD